MANWTSVQMATQALKELGIVGLGQDASAEDLAKISAVWPSIYRRLRNAGLADWTSNAIAEEAQHPLAQYVAGEVAQSFGFTGNELAEKQMLGALGLRGLQEVASGDAFESRPKFKDY